MFGLNPDNLRNIKNCFAQLPKIEKVLIYGSRAKGNYRNRSDIDITLIGKRLTLDNSIYPLQDKLEELYLPYQFDISIFDTLDNLEFISHILQVGKTFYEKNNEKLPEGWEMKRIVDVTKIITGGTPKTHIKEYWDGNIAWITPSDLGKLKTREVSLTRRTITDNGLQKSSAKLFPVNSVILSSRAPIGHLAINTVPMSTNQGCRGIVPKENLVNVFLYYFLKGNISLLSDLGTGATFKELSTKALGSVLIPLPPLPEQKRIVSVLDKVFAAIDQAKVNAKQNLQNVAALFESYLQGELTDKKRNVVKLGEICEKIEYGSSSKSSSKGKLPVLRMGNIQNRKLVWDDLKYSNNEEDNVKYLLKYNDVLFNRTNSPEWVGKTAIYKGEMPAIFAGYLIRIIRKEDLLDADYLNYYLNSKVARDYGDTVVISSVNQANINGTKLKTYPIPLPTLEQQKQIVQKLDALSAETKKLEAIYTQKIAILEEMKKSVLQKAFKGEL